jgi:hypothetical protein
MIVLDTGDSGEQRRGNEETQDGRRGGSPVVIAFAANGREQTKLIASGTYSAVIVFANLKQRSHVRRQEGEGTSSSIVSNRFFNLEPLEVVEISWMPT